MSNRLLNAAWKARCGTISQKLVLARLADHADAEGRCWPSHTAIAADVGLSDRAVRTAIGELASADHLTIETAGHRADRGASRFTYHVHPSTPEEASAVTPETPSGVNEPDTGSPFPCDTGKRRHPHRKMTTPTPENDDIPVYRTLMNPHEPLEQTRAEGFVLDGESPQATKEKKRDLVFEEIAKLHGGHKGLTKPMRDKINTALKAIKASCKETGTALTVEEVTRRIDHLQRKYADLPNAWTSSCLARDWHLLAHPPQAKANGHATRKQIEALEDALKRHPGNREALAYDPETVTTAQTQEFQAKREELIRMKGTAQ